MVNYTLLGTCLPTFCSTGLGRTARQIAAPSARKYEFPCKEVPLEGLVDSLQFGDFGSKNPQFWGPEIGNPIIKKIVNSKTVLDIEKVTIDYF